MREGLSPALISSIPDTALRHTYALKLTDYDWENSPTVGALLDSLDNEFVVRLATRATAHVASAIAAKSTSASLLTALYHADRRVTVRVHIAKNEHTPTPLVWETVNSASDKARGGRVQDIIATAQPHRLLELMSHPDLREAILRHGHVREIAAYLYPQLQDLPVQDWPTYLGTGHSSLDLLAYMTHAGTTPEQARKLLASYPLPTRVAQTETQHARLQLASCAVSGSADAALRTHQQAALLETGVALLHAHPHIGYDAVASVLEDAERAGLAEAATRSRLLLTAMMARDILTAASHGVRIYGQANIKGVTDDACLVLNEHPAGTDSTAVQLLLRAILNAGTPRQVALVLSGPHGAGSPRQPLHGLQRRSDADMRQILKHLDASPKVTIHILADYLRRGNSALGSAETLPLPRYMTQQYLSALATVVKTGVIGDTISATWGQLLRSREDVRHVLDLADAYPAAAPQLVSLALMASWWRSGGRRDTSLRGRLLGLAERLTTDKGTPYWDATHLESPLALTYTPPKMAEWLHTHSPRAVAYLLRSVTRRYGPLTDLEAALIPHFPLRWTAMTEGLAAAAGTYLQGQLTEAREWEAALVLLPEWDGRLHDLTHAARVLART